MEVTHRFRDLSIYRLYEIPDRFQDNVEWGSGDEIDCKEGC